MDSHYLVAGIREGALFKLCTRVSGFYTFLKLLFLCVAKYQEAVERLEQLNSLEIISVNCYAYRKRTLVIPFLSHLPKVKNSAQSGSQHIKLVKTKQCKAQKPILKTQITLQKVLKPFNRGRETPTCWWFLFLITIGGAAVGVPRFPPPPPPPAA